VFSRVVCELVIRSIFSLLNCFIKSQQNAFATACSHAISSHFSVAPSWFAVVYIGKHKPKDLHRQFFLQFWQFTALR